MNRPIFSIRAGLAAVLFVACLTTARAQSAGDPAPSRHPLILTTEAADV